MIFLRRYLILFFLVIIPSLSYAASQDLFSNNEKGVTALNEGSYRKAIEYFMLALRHGPDNEVVKNNLANAYNNFGYDFLEKGETLNAIDKFERALSYNPDSVYILINLGRAHYKKNELEKAIRYLRDAYNIDPSIKGLKALLDKASNEIKVEARLDRFETTHFMIVFENTLQVDNLANIRISLEQAYSRIGAFLDHFPKKKTTVILYPEASYEKITSGRPYWSHAVFDGKIRIPLAKMIYSKDFLSQVIYHEYTHVIIRDLAKGNCPIWLNEGVACYSEGFVKSRSSSFFTQYINSETFIPFMNLPNSYNAINDAQRANLLYREFYLLANFISDKFGNQVLRKMLIGLGKGESVEDVLRQTSLIGFEEFGQMWQGYVNNKLGL